MSTPNIPLTLNRDALPISASVNDILIKYTSALAEIQRLLAEVERLTPYVSKAILTHGGTMLCSPQVGVAFNEQQARAERAEAAETVALANWNGALERAMKAEADLAALEQCHDDNCRALVKLEGELATERARLDAGTILLTVAGERVWHCGVDLRAAIDAAMKEGAK
jgi:hypothetical protein